MDSEDSSNSDKSNTSVIEDKKLWKLSMAMSTSYEEVEETYEAETESKFSVLEDGVGVGSMIEEPATPKSSIGEKEKPKHRAKMRATNDLQKIFHTIRQENSLYYISKAKSINRTEERDDTPARFFAFDYPTTQEHFTFKNVAEAWRKNELHKEMKKKCCCKGSYNTKLKTDILDRLYVIDPDDIKGIKTVLDIDPEFYTIVEGRPIPKPFTMSRYLDTIRNVLRTKLMEGFRNDEMLLLDEKLKLEKEAITNITHNFNSYVTSFEECLSEDYEDSMHLLGAAEKAAILTSEKTNQIRKLQVEHSALEFNVHKLEERWRDLKMYQKFLYYVSPISWRQKYDYIHNLNEEEENTTGKIFKKYDLTSQMHLPSLTNLVDEYLACEEYEEEPALYFTSAVQLRKVFRFIEIQNLNCLLHTEEIEVPMENMKQSMIEAQMNFEKEANVLQKEVDSLNEEIDWEEGSAIELEQTAKKQIDDSFRKLVSDDEVLKLNVWVQDVYESCVAKTDSELSLIDMMIAIEEAYNNLVLILDGLPQEIVKRSEKYRFAEQARLAKLCSDTAYKLAVLESITWRLKKSLEPPYQKKRELKWRSAPPDRKEIPPPPPREPTELEKEYLSYFTVYCALTDKVEDYGIDLSVPETDLRKYSVVMDPAE